MITHWDEVDGVRRERGHLAASVIPDRDALRHRRCATHLDRSRPLGDAPAPRGLGGRDLLRPLRHRCLRPVGGEKEASIRRGRRGLSRPPRARTRATRSSPDDEAPLVVLAFGQRHYAANTLLPRAGVSWLGPTWVLEGAPTTTRGRERLPSGLPRWTELAERPPRIVQRADVPTSRRRGVTVAQPAASSAAQRARSEPVLGLDVIPAAHEPASQPLGRGGDLRRARW